MDETKTIYEKAKLSALQKGMSEADASHAANAAVLLHKKKTAQPFVKKEAPSHVKLILDNPKPVVVEKAEEVVPSVPTPIGLSWDASGRW